MLAIDSRTAHIWVLDLARITAEPGLLAPYHDLLSNEEAARLKRFAFPKLQHHYLATRAMLRCCLSRYADVAPQQWQFAQEKNGKPYLVNSPLPLSFNLSHAGERAVLAITKDRQIGVDIEQLSRKRDWLGIAEHYFHNDEVDDLHNVPEAHQHLHFFRLWTLKEAYLKARGTGIATGLDKAAFVLNKGKISARFAPELGTSTADWYCTSYYLGEDYCLSLACHTPGGQAAPALHFYQSWPLASECAAMTPLDNLVNLDDETAQDGQLA